MSAIQLFDLNGEQRFTGTAVGGAPPGPYAYFAVNDVAIASAARFAWTPIVGAAYPNNAANAALLFDLSTPTTPAAVSAGVYAISVEVICDSAHAGKVLGAYLFFDVDGADDGPGTYGIPLDSGYAVASTTAIRALTAGTKIEANPSHDIGGTPTLSFWALAQRIT